MLALTPAPLQTAGERALFDELARWDTGGSVRAAVVASIPLADGPLQRRLSDAVLFVPEGVAVVRVVEVVRQSGVVTASPEGAWTIGPEGAPARSCSSRGGGSTPLDGLMRAGMDTAVRLRRAGLEPGRIARLTVLVGDVTGLVPADGDLGEGDQVCLLDTALAAARASPGPAATPASTTPGSGRRPTCAPPSRRSACTGRGPVGRGAQRRGLPVLARTSCAARSCWPPRRWRPWPPPARLPRPPRPVPPRHRPRRPGAGAGRGTRAAARSPRWATPVAAAQAAAAASASARRTPAPTRDTVAVDGPPRRRTTAASAACSPTASRSPVRPAAPRTVGLRAARRRRQYAPAPSAGAAVVGAGDRRCTTRRSNRRGTGTAAGVAANAAVIAAARGRSSSCSASAAGCLPGRSGRRRRRGAAGGARRRTRARARRPGDVQTVGGGRLHGRGGRGRQHLRRPRLRPARAFLQTTTAPACPGRSTRRELDGQAGRRLGHPGADARHGRRAAAAGAGRHATAPATSATCCARACGTPAARPAAERGVRQRGLRHDGDHRGDRVGRPATAPGSAADHRRRRRPSGAGPRGPRPCPAS